MATSARRNSCGALQHSSGARGAVGGGCGALIERHVPKTGGTTVRSMLRANARMGCCDFYGYDVSRTWPSRVGFAHRALTNVSGVLHAAAGRARAGVEAHVVGERFWEEVAELRAGPYGRACRVLVFVRVRAPAAWYASFYDWAVAPRLARGAAEARGEFGDNFSHWLALAPPSLQCHFLLEGSPEAPFDRRHWNGYSAAAAARVMAPAARRRARALSGAQWARLRRIVAVADVAAPLERLDEVLGFRRGARV